MKITIFKKLLLGFAILLCLTCLVSGVGVYSLLDVKSRVEKILTQNIQLQHTVHQISNNLLKARQGEKDFFLTADPQYVEQVGREIQKIKQGCQKLCALVVDSEDSLRAIRLFLMADKYYKGFISVVEKVNEKWQVGGNTSDALGRKARLFEDAVKKTGQEQLLIDLLTIRRYERSCLFKKYVEPTAGLEKKYEALNIKRPILEFKADVQKSSLDEDTKLNLKRIADEYCQLFTKIITIDASIERLRGIYNDTARRMEQIVQQINFKSTGLADHTIITTDQVFKRSGRIILILSLISLIAGVILALFISKGFSRPVVKLSRVVKEVAAGDLSQKVDIRSKDELEELGKAFNRMIESLRSSKEEIENYNRTLEQRVAERTAELLKANEELRKSKLALLNMMEDMKKINVELSYQKEFTQSILNNMADGVDVISKDYIIEFENRVLLDTFGDGVGKICYEFYLKRKEPCPHCTALKAITDGGTYSHEYEAPNGRCYLVTSSPFKKPDGTVSAIEVIRDITESKRAEQQIRQIKEFNECILTSLKEGIWVLDLDGNTIYANPAFSKLSGYSLRELKEKVKEMDLFTPGGQEIIKRENKKRLKGRSSSYETILLTKDGKKIPVLISGSPYYVDGQIKGTLGVITDISEIKKLERRLSRRHEQLKRAYQKLKVLDELKSQFIATVSHELRTPLTSILSFSEILLNYGDEDKDTRREFLTIINKESQRLSKLINDVLDLSKIESGKMEWHMDHISIRDVIKRAEDSMGVLCQRKGLKLSVDVPEDLPPVFADSDKIIQVIQNLLSNAVKFTPEGGRITIKAEVMKGRRASDRFDFIKVSVSDTGVGIAPENLKVIFEKFKQIGDPLIDKPKGTGLGLAICREIIRYHGGRIWARSQVGKGSTFSFTLPIRNLPLN